MVISYWWIYFIWMSSSHYFDDGKSIFCIFALIFSADNILLPLWFFPLWFFPPGFWFLLLDENFPFMIFCPLYKALLPRLIFMVWFLWCDFYEEKFFLWRLYVWCVQSFFCEGLYGVKSLFVQSFISVKAYEHFLLRRSLSGLEFCVCMFFKHFLLIFLVLHFPPFIFPFLLEKCVLHFCLFVVFPNFSFPFFFQCLLLLFGWLWCMGENSS